MKFNQYHTHLLFSGMAQATTKLLFEPRRDWARRHLKYDVKLKVETGPGNNAYHQRRSNSPVHKIVYGQGRIVSYSDIDKACLCAGFGELKNRYSQLELTPLSCLSHLVLHEFSHFVQVCKGQRYNGSVHNDEFYKILDRGVERNINLQISDIILNSIGNEIDLLRFISSPFDQSDQLNLSEIYLGRTVGFNSRDKLLTGKIIKVNSKTVYIACGDLRYKVPKTMLKRCA